MKAGFDYQLGSAYTPPGAEAEWGDLVLRDANDEPVVDEEWHEALLDVRTADKRERVAAKVGAWVDDCAARGFQEVEPDNCDSYTRSQRPPLRRRRPSLRAPAVIGQKNTSELAGRRRENGLDFAVAEECGEQENCDEYTAAFGDHVVVIEYTDEGLATACTRWGGSLSIVRRDRDVVPEGAAGYVRKTC